MRSVLSIVEDPYAPSSIAHEAQKACLEVFGDFLEIDDYSEPPSISSETRGALIQRAQSRIAEAERALTRLRIRLDDEMVMLRAGAFEYDGPLRKPDTRDVEIQPWDGPGRRGGISL